MKQFTHLVRASSVLAALVLMSIAAPTITRAAHAPVAVYDAGEQDHIQQDNNGSLRLNADAAQAPRSFGTFQRFGYVIAPAQQLATPTNIIRIDYAVTTPPGSAALFDARASADGTRWTAWETDLASGAAVTFDLPARFVQYRATLLGNADSPVVQRVTLMPLPSALLEAEYNAAATHFAPTYRVRATRMGMVGGRTANGHRIKANDIFVSLPSRKSLCSKGGNEYMVRVSYNGRSVVAPVYDIGPWNINDNYWDKKRVKYDDLPRGWPEDHAAYFDDYNKRRAEKGYVRFPTAVDVGDGVWRQLGIRGDREKVDVTFLWLGEDPGENAEPLAPGAEPRAAS